MSSNSDQPLLATGDFWAALGLLTRLPIRVNIDLAQKRGAAAAWAYPLVGVFVGLALALVAQFSMSLGLSYSLSACIVLFSGVMLTGALHEDGLADSADGLWGGYTPERRLEIMKDSRIGAYGVLALIFGLGLRWMALSSLFESGAVMAPILAAAAVSRAAPTVLMLGLPQARKTGLSQSVGTPQAGHVGLAVTLAVLLAIITLQSIPIVVFIATALATAACGGVAKYKIKGQTGDILGATQQVAEITILICLTLSV